MNVEFVRFDASDGVELQGWLSDCPGKLAALHVHGKSGNGYQNRFLDNLRQTYSDAGVTFFAFDNRGSGLINDFWQGQDTKAGGSCFELFAESADDIRGAIDFLKSRGKSKFILQGHSLGCAKVVNHVLTQQPGDVPAVVLLAPTDMIGWAGGAPNSADLMARAEKMVSEDLGQQLLDAECGLDKTPMSAESYVAMHEPGSPVDIYGERPGGPLLGRVELPMLIVYGDEDIGITQIDGSIGAWEARVSKFKNANTEVRIIEGAPHSYAGHEKELAGVVGEFLGRVPS